MLSMSQIMMMTRNLLLHIYIDVFSNIVPDGVKLAAKHKS